MKIIDNILNLIYPPVCGFCNQICKENLCKKCEMQLKDIAKVKTIIKERELNKSVKGSN